MMLRQIPTASNSDTSPTGSPLLLQDPEVEVPDMVAGRRACSSIPAAGLAHASVTAGAKLTASVRASGVRP